MRLNTMSALLLAAGWLLAARPLGAQTAPRPVQPVQSPEAKAKAEKEAKEAARVAAEGEIILELKYDDMELVDLIKSLALQAEINVLFDPKLTQVNRDKEGQVIPNAKVIQVLYGAGTYAPYVAPTGAGTTGAFYSGVLGSSYVTWLNGDYKTTTPAQTIGAGTFAGQVQITPSATNAPSTQNICTKSGALRVKDTQIQAELKAQIAAGKLPAPDLNTYYAIYFPAGVGISQGTSCSGVSGGFCAYHGTVPAAGTVSEFYYGVIPDFTGAAFATGCGTSTQYGNVTSVSSHELIEAITDPEVGIATVLGKPLAWYNNTYGEIGDICNGQQATITGTDGASYVVQKEWSNSGQICRV